MARKHINIRAGFDLQGFSTSGQNLEREFKKTARKMQSIGKTLSMSLTAPIVGLAGLSVVNFDKQAKSVAQVEAGLKSTGGTVGKTSQELQKMAAELQKVSLFGDEDILKNITAQLLTFTNITGDEFGRAQQAVADYASRTGRDLMGTSIMIGKALNDPIKGLAALGKAGVQFTDDQKVLIQSLVATGKEAEAQKIILEELEKQYGGSAKAAADAGMGPLQQIKNSIMDVTEAFGEIIVEYIKPLAENVKALATRFGELSDSKKRLIVIIGAAAAAIGPVMLALGFLGTTVIPALITAFTMLTGPIGLTIAAIGALAYVVYQNWDKIMSYVNQLTGYFTDLYNESLVVRVGIQSIVLVFKTVWEAGKLMVNLLVDAFKFLGKVILTPFVSLAKIVKAILTGDFKSIGGIIADAFTKPIKLAGKFLSDAAGDFKEFGMNTAKNFNDGVDAVLKREKTVILEPKTEIKMEGVTDDGDGDEVEEDDKTTPLKQLQSKLADIQFAGAQRLRQIRHEVAMLSMTDDEQIALERLNFAQEQAENELDFQISQLENKKVLSEDEKAQLQNLQNEKTAIIERYFAELAAMENEANANQLGIKEAALKKENDLLKLANLEGFTNQEDFDKKELDREVAHIEALIALRKQYGKDVTDLEVQLAEKRGEIQKGANEKAESLAADLAQLVTSQIQAVVSGTVDAMSSFIEGAFSGVEGQQQDFGKAFMAVLGKFMGDFGKAMVALGIAQQLTISSIASMNPIGLIAGGIALAAAGAAITGLSKRGLNSSAGGGVDSSGGANVNSNVSNIDVQPIIMETRIEGNQLILVQNRSNSFRR
jgi:hypothetical protein